MIPEAPAALVNSASEVVQLYQYVLGVAFAAIVALGVVYEGAMRRQHQEQRRHNREIESNISALVNGIATLDKTTARGIDMLDRIGDAVRDTAALERARQRLLRGDDVRGPPG